MGTLETRSFPALGTTAQVTVTNPASIDTAERALRSELDALDRACSRFRPDSELSRLNAAGGRPVKVGTLLREALEVAIEAAHVTDGLVDPTIGRSLVAIGYDRDFASLTTAAPRARVHLVVAPGWQTIAIDRTRGTVQVPAAVSLDLGATAKALAADRAAAAAHAATGCGVLISLGGDIAVAGPAPEGGFAIRVTDDHRDLDGPGPTVAITGGGLATSSTTVRRWRAGGHERHHIVDPRSGLPASQIWRTVTVAAASCVHANTASTGAIVRGEGALEWLEGGGWPARLVASRGAVSLTGTWPEDAR